MRFDSYENAGIRVAVALVNRLTAGHDGGRPFVPDLSLAAVQQILDGDLAAQRQVRQSDCGAFVHLAADLRVVFEQLERGNIDAAAACVNKLLERYPANPHLEKNDGIWQVHHHPADTDVCSMWAAACAGAIAGQIGAQNASRFGVCNAVNCDRVFADVSRNGSRRFCSTSCQNRTKAAAFRRRKAD